MNLSHTSTTRLYLGSIEVRIDLTIREGGVHSVVK